MDPHVVQLARELKTLQRSMQRISPLAAVEPPERQPKEQREVTEAERQAAEEEAAEEKPGGR